MRIKIITSPPIPHLKFWFQIPEPLAPGLANILQLKRMLVVHLETLSDFVPAHRLSLSLEGFEILDSSPCNILRDGDMCDTYHLVAEQWKPLTFS